MQHLIHDTGIIITPKGNMDNTVSMFMCHLKKKFPFIPLFFANDADPYGVIDIEVATYGKQDFAKMNKFMTVPSAIGLYIAGCIYENGELDLPHCEVLKNADYRSIHNAIESYRSKNHCNSIFLRNKLKLMEVWGHKRQLNSVEPQKLYNQIMGILALAKEKDVDLNSTLR